MSVNKKLLVSAELNKMKKIIAAFAVALSSTAFAIPFTWTDKDPSGDVLNFNGDKVSGRLSILAPDADAFSETAGFRPGIDTLSSARVAWHFDGVARDVDWPISGWQLSAFTAISTTWAVSGVPVEFKAWGPIATLGYLDFTITYKGDGTVPLTLDFASVVATGDQKISTIAQVPDGGATAIMVGGSIAGLALLRRRRA
jgi:hypothetical protein